MTRDPRVDPRPADVVHRDDWDEILNPDAEEETRYVTSVTDATVRFKAKGGCALAYSRQEFDVFLSDWRSWASTATIIQRGDDER